MIITRYKSEDGCRPEKANCRSTSDHDMPLKVYIMIVGLWYTCI